MKRSVFVISAAILSTGMYAQNIVLDPATVVEEGPPSELIDIEITLTNNGSTQDMMWMRTMNDIPDEWKSSVCDFNLCWAYNNDMPSYPFSATGDGASGTVYVKFDARNIWVGEDLEDKPGCGYVEVVYYSPADSANYTATGLFEARLGVNEDCTVAIYNSGMENSFHVYPNPAVNDLHAIASANAGVDQLALVNIVGNKVKVIDWVSAAGKMMIDITDLTEGIYFAQFINTSGKVLFTEKIAVSK